MTALVQVAGKRKAYVASAAEIYDAFQDTSLDEIHVKSGTYDFNGTTTELVLRSNTKYFINNATFKNAQIITETEDSGDVYGSSNLNVQWDSSNSRWVRQDGTSWAASTGWELFCRDSWYTHSSSDGTYFYPNETPVGTGLTSNQWYLLCVPTENVYAEGYLELDFDAGSITSSWMQLYGLKNCRMERLTVRAYDCWTCTGNGMYHRYCAQTDFPVMELVHQVRSDDFGVGIYFNTCFHCTARDTKVVTNYNASNGYYGIYLRYCRNFRLQDAYCAGNTTASASDSIYHYLLNYSHDCLVRGHSIAPHATGAGSGVHVVDTNGSGNTKTLITRTS